MPERYIDVWDVRTFDPALSAILDGKVDLLRNYFAAEHKIFLEHDVGAKVGRPVFRPLNLYAKSFATFGEAVGNAMRDRTIRAYHYTRLTDGEVAALKRNGIELSTPQTLRRRLHVLVCEALLTRDEASTLYAASLFQGDQREIRSGKFWMTSHPVASNDSSVTPLLQHWGGEVASMWIEEDAKVLERLVAIGTPRIIEIAVPMVHTKHSHSAGVAIVAAYAKSHGSISDKMTFDLYTERALSSTAVLAVISEDDASFHEIGRGHV